MVHYTLAPPASRLFTRACKLLPAERPSFLDQECREDVGLRREVEELPSYDEPESEAPEASTRDPYGSNAPGVSELLGREMLLLGRSVPTLQIEPLHAGDQSVSVPACLERRETA